MDRDSWSMWSVFLGPWTETHMATLAPWTETHVATLVTWTETHVAIFSTMDRDTNERFSPWTETVVTVVQHFSSMDRDTVYLLIQSGEALERLDFTDIVYQLLSLQQKYLKKLTPKPL